MTGSMGSIMIPATVQEAVSELNGIHELLTAKGWTKAAIVAAFAEAKPTAGDSKTRAGNPARLSLTEFTELGINGLRDRDTVSYYVRAWEGTGLPTPVPGKKCKLPDDPWPPASEFNGRDYEDERQNASIRDVDDVKNVIEKAKDRHGPQAVAKVLAQDEEVADHVEAENVSRRIRNRNTKVRNDTVENTNDHLEEVEETWRNADTGKKSKAAQEVVLLTRRVVEARLAAELAGDTSSELINAVTVASTMLDSWKQSLTGSGSVTWTDNDRTIAEELGIDLEATA